MKKRLAIIGSGVSGLVAAHLLYKEYDIDIFEKNDYIGGHTHTVNVANTSIDTGFIVFNNKTYPNFKKILDRLKVRYRKTEMSFAVTNSNLALEYKGHNINTLFSDRLNIFRIKFYRFIFDILRFNKIAKKVNRDDSTTLGEFLQNNKFGEFFINGYILPMGSAIWSMGLNDMLSFPVALFTKFFNNHGLLNIRNRPQWYTIEGGSSNYIPQLIKGYENKIILNTKVLDIFKDKENLVLTFENKEPQVYDKVICACHSNEAVSILNNNLQKEVLSKIRYSKSSVVLHTDSRILPKRNLAHASWNYRTANNSNDQATLTYNMNILQGLTADNTYCITLNSDNLINENKIVAKFEYEHPIYSCDAISAQNSFEDISGIDNIYFCGAYWANGFHEDGVNSAIRVAKQLGVDFV